MSTRQPSARGLVLLAEAGELPASAIRCEPSLYEQSSLAIQTLAAGDVSPERLH
jgi:hypothetical protein